MTPQQAVSLYESANPFTSAAALAASNYSAVMDGNLVRLLDWKEPSANAKMTDKSIRAFLSSARFSCVAAKASVRSGGYRFGWYEGFPARRSAAGLARDLAAFVAEQRYMRSRYTTFVAAFAEQPIEDELSFERALWKQLQYLHEEDAKHFPWAPGVSADPQSVHFAFSFAQSPFFVVGMHPRSSRDSRRLFVPALAFNAHAQFAAAKRDGNFERIQRIVREREIALQGSVNPELRAYGESSEARQYAGRQTEQKWRCPFHRQS
ncbi:MAG: guanitoxin biosynthesis heme-dependent pre-guanitoxin N-hydroxylase GntA [Candidatus Baltobacteraceae bacterium]